MTRTDDNSLARALGRWDLLALAINGIVGSGIFGLPAKVHALVGVYGLWAIVACACIVGLIVLCFAEVSSRFDETGGPFVYAGTAFGPLMGFLTGWVLWFARLSGCCAIASLLLQYLAYFEPELNRGVGRVLTALAVIGALTAIHYVGIKRAALFGNVVTLLKLTPLLAFVLFGLWHVEPALISQRSPPANAHFAQAVLMLGFAFVGWESAVVTAGESRDPRHDLPFALIAGLGIVALLYLMIQLVCVGTLPDLAVSNQPIVDAAQTFFGAGGVRLMAAGAVMAMVGTLTVAMLTVSRVQYAMAVAGQVPRFLATIHPRFLTPHLSVVICGVLVLAFTLSGSFVYLLTVSTISRLLAFAVTCAALPKLRGMATVQPARFVLAGGALIPCAALASIGWLLTSSSWAETRDVAILIMLGALVYCLGRRRMTRVEPSNQNQKP